MSLSCDRFFVAAITQDEELMNEIGGRIFDPARDSAAEEADVVPYVIVSLDSVQNIDMSKDDVYESMIDEANVSVLIVADDRESLAHLAEKTRRVINKALVSSEEEEEETQATFGFSIYDSSFSASRVELDIDKPCCYQTLSYICKTENV